MGVQTQIWNNNAHSMALLVAYPALIMAVVWAIAFLLGGTANFAHMTLIDYWPLIMGGCGIWFLISYFFHGHMIRSMSHSQPVTRKQEPELYNMLENLCIAEGMAMPRLEIIETHARNAYASGINDKTYAVTVTRGLLNTLQPDEVEAVLAHELGHIRHHDVRLLMITIIFTGLFAFLCQLAWSNFRYRMFSRRNNNGAMILLIMAVLGCAYLLSQILRFTLSRKREFMADAASIQMTKNPDAMMRALLRISGRDRIPEATEDVAIMCIENSHKFLGLFQTHPPIEKRLAAISQNTNTAIPQVSYHQPAEHNARFGQANHTNNPWLTAKRRNPWQKQ